MTVSQLHCCASGLLEWSCRVLVRLSNLQKTGQGMGPLHFPLVSILFKGPNGEGMVTSGVEGHQSERETLFYQQLTVARILLLNTLFFRGGGLIKKKRRGNKNLRRRSSKGLFWVSDPSFATEQLKSPGVKVPNQLILMMVSVTRAFPKCTLDQTARGSKRHNIFNRHVLKVTINKKVLLWEDQSKIHSIQAENKLLFFFPL